jgi:hypothetical protein
MKKPIMGSTGSETIDTVGYLYGSKLFLYKSNKTFEYLIICESGDELYSDFSRYYLKDSLFVKIGYLPIQCNCNTCVDSTYPINKFDYQDKSCSSTKTWTKLQFKLCIGTNFAVNALTQD